MWLYGIPIETESIGLLEIKIYHGEDDYLIMEIKLPFMKKQSKKQQTKHIKNK